MLPNIRKTGSHRDLKNPDSVDQCQFEALISEVKFNPETSENFDEEL